MLDHIMWWQDILNVWNFPVHLKVTSFIFFVILGDLLLCNQIVQCCFVLYKFKYTNLYNCFYMNLYSNICIGTDAMGSKLKKQAIIKNNSITRKHRINKKDSEDARHWVGQRALTSKQAMSSENLSLSQQPQPLVYQLKQLSGPQTSSQTWKSSHFFFP